MAGIASPASSSTGDKMMRGSWAPVTASTAPRSEATVSGVDTSRRSVCAVPVRSAGPVVEVGERERLHDQHLHEQSRHDDGGVADDVRRERESQVSGVDV